MAGEATQYDYLIANAYDRWAKLKAFGEDASGAAAAITVLAHRITSQDDAIQEELAEIREKTRNPPHGVDEEDWEDQMRDDHLAVVLACLGRHGYLDRAPTPETDDGLSFLGG